MEHFFDNIKEVAGNGQENVPAGYGWDEMKEGINEKMDPKDRILPDRKHRSRKRIVWIFLLFLALAATYVFFQFGPEDADMEKSGWSDQQIVAEQSTTKKDDGEISTQPGMILDAPLSSNRDFTFEDSGLANEKITDPSTLVSGQSLTSDFTNANNENISENSKTGSASISSVDTPAVFPGINEKNVEIISGQHLPGATDKKQILVDRMHRKSFFLFGETRSLSAPGIHLTKTESISCNFHDSSYLGLHSGTNVLLPFFGGYEEIRSLRSEHTQAIFGQQVVFSLVKPLNNSLFIRTSLGYHGFHEELDVQFDKPVTHLIKDALVRVDSNAITSRKTYYIQDTVVGAIERRTILHYNTYRVLNLSASIGRNWCIDDNWFARASLGIRYSRLLQADGRQLGADYSVIDFNDEQPIHAINHFSVTSSLGLYRKISRKIYLGGEILLSQYFTNWSNEMDISNYPLSSAIQLGVLYSF